MATQTTKTEEKTNKGIGLTPIQLIASTLAAITAAFLGSTLGVAGTVIGAGAASLVSTVGSALYQQSLARASSRLRSRVTAVRRHEPIRVEEPGGQPPQSTSGDGPTRKFTPVTAANPANSGSSANAPTRRISFDAATQRVTFDAPTQRLAVGAPTTVTEKVAPPDTRRRRPRWQLVAGLTVIAFVLSIGVVTAVELLHGGPISGGNAGTTVGSLFGESTQHATQSSTPTAGAATTTPGASTGTATSTTTVAPTTTSGAPATTTTTAPTSSSTAATTTTVAPTTTTQAQAPAVTAAG
ncbi:MAG TPA: hypothetical protein VG756_30000 [Pseudonocardiaceae bacterium]|jgi:hypothetical protein|nr:hypothetical protein [Pseudonocardiaceae bacterium]